MDPLREQARAIEEDRLRRAGRQSPGEKVAAGLRLFAQVKRRMVSGIRAQYPDADEAAVNEHLRRWLRSARENENQPWTK